MTGFAKTLLLLSALSFVAGVVVALVGSSLLFGITAEGYSRASVNLALLAIGAAFVFKEQPRAG